MASQAIIRNSEWQTSPVPYRDHSLTLVSRRSANQVEFTPWTIVAPSHLLRRLGIDSLGLYAARSFKKDDYIGVYPQDDVVGRYASREEAMSAPAARKRLMRGRDKLITVRAQGGGVLLVDGESGGGAQVPRANDPRGTRLSTNCVITEGGYLRVTVARIPAFDLEKDNNTNAEIRISYGDDFWALQGVLGKSAEYAIEVD